MVFINATETIGKILLAGAGDVAGSMFLVLFMLVMILFAMCIFFGIPLEFGVIIIFPVLIASSVYYGQFVPLIVVLLFYFTFLFVRRFSFR